MPGGEFLENQDQTRYRIVSGHNGWAEHSHPLYVSSHLPSNWSRHGKVTVYPSTLHNTLEYRGKTNLTASSIGSWAWYHKEKEPSNNYPLAPRPDSPLHIERRMGQQKTHSLQKESRWTLHSLNSQSHTVPAGVRATCAICRDGQQRKFPSYLFTTEEADGRKGGSWRMSTQWAW